MRIFITGVNTDVGKTYATKHLYHVLETRGHRVYIFKLSQTEECRDGTSPDLEVFKNEYNLSYDIMSLYIFKQPVSPCLAFKMVDQVFLNKQYVLDKVRVLDKGPGFALIEGAGGIAVPIYGGADDFYIAKDLISDCAGCVISTLPSKLGAISDAITHQDYVSQSISAGNFSIMNRYAGSYTEKNNQITIGKLTDKTVYTFEEHTAYENSSEVFLKQLIGIENELHTTA